MKFTPAVCRVRTIRRTNTDVLRPCAEQTVLAYSAWSTLCYLTQQPCRGAHWGLALL